MVKKAGGAPIGNKNGIKIKDKESRQQVFKAYLSHLESGFPKEAFSYSNEHEETCCWKTMNKWIKENPIEFPPILIEQAMAKRYKLWFEIGMKMVRGSPVVWQTIMRNMFKEYGWDQDDSKQSAYTPEQEATIKSIFSLMSKRQEDAKVKK